MTVPDATHAPVPAATDAPARPAAWLDRAERVHSTAFIAAALAFAVLWQLAAPDTTGAWYVPVMATLALVAGLPHGALDLWVSRRAGLWRTLPQCAAWHARYVAVALGVVALFLLAPRLALVGFLLMAVFHFSDDWNGALPRPLRWAAAALLVLVPCVAHPGEVAAIFAVLAAAEPAVEGAVWAEAPWPLVQATLWFVAGVAGLAFFTHRRAGAEVATLVLLAVVLPPLAFFLVYFAFLHGPRHMLHERDALGGAREAAAVAAYAGLALVACFATAWWLFGDAVVGDAGVGDAVARGTAAVTDSDLVLRAVFIGLAALTAPHVILVERARNARTAADR